MKTFKLSNNDEIPALGLGTWKSKPGEVYNAVREAIRIGYRHIDCAYIYMNEAEIGKALDDAFKAGDVKREELWITSKLWNNAHLVKDVRPALENTLKDLNLDYLDLYLIHWPVALKPGVGFPESADDFLSLDEIPIAKTWEAMEKCAKEGLSKHIGVSNFSIKKIRDLISECEIRPEVNQIEMHPLLAQTDMLEFCEKENIVLTAYSPLGSTDRPQHFKSPDEPSLMENSTVVEIASGHNCSPAQVLIRWAIQRGTSVIPKSVNPSRIKQNFEAASMELTNDDMQKLAELDNHDRIITGGFWNAPAHGYTMESLWDE
jgi:alcohol dehydrogenase (NADP+)